MQWVYSRPAIAPGKEVLDFRAAIFVTALAVSKLCALGGKKSPHSQDARARLRARSHSTRLRALASGSRAMSPPDETGMASRVSGQRDWTWGAETGSATNSSFYDDEGEEEDSRHAEDEEAIEAEEDLLEQIIYTVGKLLETQGEGAVARRWLVPVTADGHICHDGQWARAIVCCVDESECPYACQ